jgi:CBS domain-containing protein
MQVKDMMTVDPACCTAETSLPEVARMMVDKDCGEIPVVENTSSKLPIGVVTDRDIVCRIIANGLNPLDLTAADCMSKPTVTVTPDISLEECCRIMEEKLIRRVPVVDERGACVGIITLADIALHTGKNVAGHIVKEVSEPTSSASAASAAAR